MSDLGDFSDILGPDPDPGAIAYARGAILWGAAAAGQGVTAARQALSDAGIGMRYDQVSAMWQDIQTAQAEAQGALGIGFDQLGTGALAEAAPVNWTGQYTYRVNFTTRTKDEEGNYSLESTPKWFISANELSPEDAVSAAQNMIELPAGVGTPDGIEPSDVVMANLSGVWYRTQPGILGGL